MSAAGGPAAGENRLITLAFSHYCEKARWALDRARVPYREVTQVPLLSWATTFGAGGGRTVPCLVTKDRVVKDSTDILRWADPALYEDDEAATLEDEFDRRLGPAVRRLVYWHLSRERPRELRELLLAGGPPMQRRVGRVVYPAIRAMILKGLGVSAEGVERSWRVVEELWERVDDRLSDGRRYLCGDRFSAADLTFASLGGGMVLPPQLEPVMPPMHLVPPAIAAWRDRFRATAPGKLILRLYREERGKDRIEVD